PCLSQHLHCYPTRRSSDQITMPSTSSHATSGMMRRVASASTGASTAAAAIHHIDCRFSSKIVDSCMGEDYVPPRGAVFAHARVEDRKSTRLNSSHVSISYA